MSGVKKSAIILLPDNQRAGVSYLYIMTTITFDKEIPIEKLHFVDWEDFQLYLAKQGQHRLPHETPEFFAELEKRTEAALNDRSRLRTVDDLAKTLDALK